MARSIEEIKGSMTAEWIKQPAVVKAYGLNGKETFNGRFSAASMESILFYVFAFAVWALEKLFDMHSDEVDRRIEQLEPHTLRWYVNKAKAFMWGANIAPVEDTDYYDTSKMSAEEIEAAKIVKYAVATESNTVVYLKVARQNDQGTPDILSEGQLAALRSYINEIKDAGVSVEVRNERADDMQIALVVYYDPTLLSESGGKYVLNDGSEPVREAVQNAITGLPFNGVFRKSDLLAAVQSLPCVKVADIDSVKVKPHNSQNWETVSGFNRPYSGYYSIDTLTVDYKPFDAVENV